MRSGFTNLVNCVILVLLTANLGFTVAITPRPINNRNPNLCHFPAIFNFGDSNSDTGGLSAMYGQAPPPNGVTYFGAPAGRYCDGRLIIDFLGKLYLISLSNFDCFYFSFLYVSINLTSHNLKWSLEI